MRLRARGNGKGTHEGCLCCIFARCRGQKHRGNTFLMPLFGGAGQTGEGREGQTGVEEDAGVTRFGGVLLILGRGGGVVVIRTSQRFALCGTADAGLGGGVGGGLPFVGRLANLRMADRAFMPVVVHIALPFGCGIGVVCHWDFYFRGAIVAAGTGIVGFQAFRCTGSRLGIVVNKVVAEGVTVGCITAAALYLCRAGGGAAGMNMGQVYPIILLLDLAVTGIRCEVAFIYVRDRMRPFSRGNFYGRIRRCSN